MLARRLLAYGAASIVLAAAAAAFCVAADATQSASVFVAADSAGAGAQSPAAAEWRLERLREGRLGSSDNFVARARVAFKTERRPMVRAREFDIGAADELADGWAQEGGFFVWRPGSGRPPSALSIPLSIPSEQPSFRLVDYEEAWIDYTILPGWGCAANVEIAGAVNRPGASAATIVARSGPAAARRPVLDLQPQRAHWDRKGVSYLLARELGTQPTEDWYYSQEGSNSVLQRRVFARLEDVEWLDIVVDPPFAVAHVNLRVVAVGSTRGRELLMFPDLLKTRRLPDGRAGVRLNVRAALDQRAAKRPAYAAGPQPYLTEINVFVPGPAGEVGAARPLRRVILIGSGATGGEAAAARAGEVVALPAKVESFGDMRTRTVADLRPLLGRGEIELTGAMLHLVPAGTSPCAIRVDSVRAAAPYAEVVPAYAALLENWARKWDAASRVLEAVPGEVQHPRLLAYLPFQSFMTRPADAEPPADDEGKEADQQPQRGRLAPKDAEGSRPAGQRSRWASSTGAVLRVDGRRPRLSAPEQVLEIEGRGLLEVDWPIDAAVDERTLFYFGMAAGHDVLADAILTLELEGGKVARHRVMPNRSLGLFTAPARISRARLTLRPEKAPYRMRLGEMAFFRIERASYVRALEIEVPTPMVVRPRPQFPAVVPAGVVEARDGRIAGLAPQDGTPLRFTTPLQPALSSVRGLLLKHRFMPSTDDVAHCPVEVQFNWSRGRSSRRVCITRPDGNLNVPVIDGEPGQSSQAGGELQSIDWWIRIAAGGEFDLNFAVEGWAMVSMIDRLATTALLDGDRDGVFAAAEEVKRGASEPFDGGAWITLPPVAVSRLFALGAATPIADHALFKVQQIVLAPKAPVEASLWRELDPPAPTAAGADTRLWPWVVAIALAALLAWRVLRANRQQGAGRWTTARPVGRWAGDTWERGRQWLFPRANALRLLVGERVRALRVLAMADPRKLHFLVGAVVLFPGIWLAGWLGWTFAGAMLLATLAIVLYDTYRHLRRPVQAAQETAGPLSYGAIVALIGVACAVWAIGQHNASAPGLWGFLPLLATGYVNRDAIRQWLFGKGRRYWPLITALLLGLLAAVLYRLAAGNVFGLGGKIVPIVAGVVAVFAVAGALRGLAGFAPHSHAAARLAETAAGAYFVVACIALIVAGGLVASGRDAVAEQFAMIAYLAVIVGVCRVGWRRWVSRRSPEVDADGAHGDERS